jgi:hypothetical protein
MTRPWLRKFASIEDDARAELCGPKLPALWMQCSHTQALIMKLKLAPAVPAIISWVIVAGCTASPITISESEMLAVFSPGTFVRMLWDATSRSVNVGATGGPNTYDFRDLDFHLYDSATVLAVTQIPQLAARFPPNGITLNEEGNTVYPVFSFSNHSFYRHGRARISSDTTEWYQHIIPPQEWLRFPVMFNTQFTTTTTVVVDTTYVNGILTRTSSDTTSHTDHVDGYGTLLLPGGLALKCLRVRSVAAHPNTFKEFQFWTREGVVVLIDTDTSQPDTGVIKRGYVIRFSPRTRDQNTRD